jgi:signal transduction histidine kinase
VPTDLRSPRRVVDATWPVDLALAAGAAAINVAGAVVSDPTVSYEYEDGGGIHLLLAAAAGLVLLWRRSHPLATFLASSMLVALVVALEWRTGWMPFSWLLATYALGAYASLRRGLAGITLAFVVGGVLVALQAPYFDSWLAIGTAVQMSIIWLLGCAVHARRAIAAAARERMLRAAHEAGTVAEEAARAERRRVARDLHDTVTNALSVVAVQAATTRRELPGALDRPLESIEQTARSAFADLRLMLGALRGPDRLLTSPRIGTDLADGLDTSLARVTGWSETAPTSPSYWRVLLVRDWPVDVALGMAVAAINVAGSLIPDHSTTTVYEDPNVFLMAVLAALPGLTLVARRHVPLAPILVTLAVVIVVAALRWPTGNLPGTLLLASFAVGAWAPVRSAVPAAVVVAAGATTLSAVGGPEFEGPAVWAIPLFVVPWLVGAAIRRRRIAADAAISDAEAAERELAARHARAVTDERLRVAQELTDLAGHSLAAVVVQTAAARGLADRPDLDARLAQIETAARSALENLRSLLHVLDGDTDPTASPAPGLRELSDLVDAHRRHHGPVHLDLDASVALESASLRLVVHRLVQEALANVARHAPGAAATVAVVVREDRVDVFVEDDGRVPVPAGLGPPRAGIGLVGMQERVALHGGTVAAGATRTGGFLVRARLERTSAP